MSELPGVPGARGGERGAPGPLELKLWMTMSHHHECGEPNPGSIQEQQEALTTEPTLESPTMLIIFSPKVLDKNTFSRKPSLSCHSCLSFHSHSIFLA